MILIFSACAPDLVALHDWDDGIDAESTADTGPPDPLVLTEPAPEGHRTEVDARDGLAFVGIDFDAGGVEVPADGPDWDLGARRFDLPTNGGVSGAGGGGALFLAGVALVDAALPADPVWLVDQPDGEDGNTNPDYAMGTWFDYDSGTHILTPADGTWLVRTTAGAVVALRIDSYYAATGDSGWLTFTWRVLP